jgi:hypothetical protein
MAAYDARATRVGPNFRQTSQPSVRLVAPYLGWIIVL